MPYRELSSPYHYKSDHVHRSPFHHRSSRSQCPSTYAHHRSSRPQRPSTSSHHRSACTATSMTESIEDYPPFHMTSNDYQTVFVNDTTSTNSLNDLLDHIQECRQYSIDTESDQRNNLLS